MNDRSENGTALVIAERFAPDLGGVARSGARIAGSLAQIGIKVEVLAWTKTLPPGQLETRQHQVENSDPIAVHRLGLFANMDLSLQHTMNVLEWLDQTSEFSFVWGHYLYPAGFLAVMFAETYGIASAVSARGNDVDRLMFPPGDFSRLIWTLDRATTRTAVSKQLVDKINVLLGAQSGAVVVPNVVDVETFRPTRINEGLKTSLGIGSQELVLGFCGELRYKKGLPFLLAALSQVRRQRAACLLVIGEVRPREQSQLHHFTLEDPDSAARILVTDRLDDPAEVAEHLQLCDLFLQPSVWDGVPNALLEAMACGKIALGSDAGGIPEVLRNQINGFVIPKAHLDKLGTAILEVAALPSARRSAISREARATVLRNHHPDLEKRALQGIVGSLLR